MVTRVRTLDFLPDIFRTDYNSQFLRAVLDPLVQDKDLKRVEGYIGSKFGPGVNALSSYVPEYSKSRTDYQLEPGVIFLKTNTPNPRDYITYPEILDSLSLEGGLTNNANRLFTQEYYAWDSFINLDTLINYSQYYWLEDGPPVVNVSGLTTTINVDTDIIGQANYTSPNGVTFINGLKIIFDDAVMPSTYSDVEYYVEGVGTSIRLITVVDQVLSRRFGIPEYLPWSELNWDIGVWDIRLRTPKTKDYITINRNSDDRNAWSRSNQWFHIDVIKASALYNNNSKLLLIANDTTRAKRPIIEFYGNLRLFNNGTSYISAIDFLDTRTPDAYSYVAGSSVYYPDVKAYTKPTASVVSQTISFPQSTATLSVPTTDLTGTIDSNNYIGTDGSSIIPNSAQVVSVEVAGSNTLINIKWPNAIAITVLTNLALVVTPQALGAYSIFDGARVIFTADTNPNVRNRVYFTQYDSTTGVYNIIPDLSSTVISGVQTLILRGYNHIDYDYWFNGVTWVQAQQKYAVNQEPLFDVYNNNGISFGDTSLYPSSSFIGSKLFSYTRGTGSNDPVLGFPLSYTGNITNIGEITYTVNLNSDTFAYITNNITNTVAVNTGYVHSYTDYDNYTRKIGWVKSVAPSVQYQLFEINYDINRSSNTVTLDIPADYVSAWPAVQVYYNNVQQSSLKYTWISNGSTTTVTFVPPAQTTVVQILILSNSASSTGYYVIPINLSKNPFNVDITSATTSDMRYYLQSIFYNSNLVSGSPLGENNYRNAGNLLSYGSTIVKHSASIVAPATLLRDGNYSLFNALQFNAREYLTYKNLLVYTVNQLQFDAVYSTQYMLDAAMKVISDTKSNTGSFFWSDMVPNGTVYSNKNYTFNSSTTIATFPLSRVYDYTAANYWGLLVYVTSTVNGISSKMLLVKDRDYTVSTTTPYVVVNVELQTGDVVTVSEYNVTYGSYVPNTPTKLGMWPATIPYVYTDTALLSPTTFIVGHDGSHTKIWGQLDGNGNLVDFRDRVLLEFETRIYNNLKLEGFNVLDPYDYLPGFWRTSDYSYSEWLDIYSPQFLNWVGTNRIDYKTQQFRQNDQFTWNYRSSRMRIDNSEIEIGYWRQLYEYMYDTSRPDIAPWELLHYDTKPTWWENRYGGLPYTSENLLLWSELAAGYDWNDGSPRTVSNAVRPGLLEAIPVDTEGVLLSPFTSLVGNYLNYNFNDEWKVGDGGPAEWSYRRSSSWPYDFCRMIALQYPAQFYNLYIDVDHYRWSAEFDQYLINNRSTLNYSDLQLYGTGTPATSYLNWIIDYQLQWGGSATTALQERFKNLDVRLVYRAAAFTDKDLLKFYVERVSPQSARSTLLIPDESYHVLMHDNTPFDRINYSSVIIQRTDRGWRVYGNSQTVQTFKTAVPIINGDYETVTVLNLSAQLPNTYSDRVLYVPYGTEFIDHYALAQFIANYGVALQRSGCVFNEIEEGIPVTWRQMVAETLYWLQSGWSVGSTVNINPGATVLKIDRPYSIVQPLTIRNQNFVLNQNLYNIQNTDLAIVRNDNLFSVSTQNVGDTIAYAQFNLSSIEHGIVFDNITAFNDVIYNLPTGVRHNRVLMRGWLTSNWIGNLDANGFILNMDDVEEWNTRNTYTPGVIVTYRNRYYIATQIIQPSNKFDENLWRVCNYNRIQKGLLPNSATRSTEAALYYDTYQTNLENDADLLGFSLIGYRSRDYMTGADLTDITQVNIYKNMIKQKGTALAAEYFDGAQLAQDRLQYDIYEIWSIKTYDFGGVLNSNYIELRLEQSLLTGNPTLLALKNSTTYPGIQQSFLLAQLHDYGRLPPTINVLPTITSAAPSPYGNAGYVHFDDVAAWAYYFYDLSNANRSIYDIYVNDYIWLAQFKSAWGVYSPVSAGYSDAIGCNPGCTLVGVLNNGNGTATLQFSGPHGLQQYDPFGVYDFNTLVDGYYTAAGVIDERTVYVTTAALDGVNTLSGNGIMVRYINHRVATPGAISTLPLTVQEFVRNRAWVDTSTSGDWAVYIKRLNYTYRTELNSDKVLYAGHWDILDWDEPLWDELVFNEWGTAAVTSARLGVIVSDPLNGILYRYQWNILTKRYDRVVLRTSTVGYGRGLAHNNDLLFVANPDDSTVDVFYAQWDPTYKEPFYIQTLTVANNGTMTVSGDSRFLYVSDAQNNTVRVFTGTSNFTGTIAYTVLGSITGSITGNTLTVTAVDPGVTLTVNQTLASSYVAPGTYITAFGTGVGGIGTYTVSNTQNTISTSINVGWSVLTVTDMVDGAYLTVGSYIAGSDVAPRTTVLQTGDALSTSILNITANGAHFTVTTAARSGGWVAGSSVTIAGSTAPSFNGTWTILSGTSTSFTVASTVNVGGAGSGGGATAGSSGSVGAYVVNSPYRAASTAMLGINYTLGATLTGVSAPGDAWGNSIATDYYSTNTVIGSPGVDNATFDNWGRADFFSRLQQHWEVDITSAGVFTCTWTPTARVSVTLNNTLLGTNLWSITGSTLTVTAALNPGDIVGINDVLWTLQQSTTSPLQPQRSSYYGWSAASNRAGSDVLIGAPFEINPDNSEGAVYRYTHGAIRYGTITGVCKSRTVVRTILINGYAVALPPCSALAAAASAADAINTAAVNNVVASAVDNTLIISLRNFTSAASITRLTIVVPDTTIATTVLDELGFTLWSPTATLLNPHASTTSQYGWAITFSNTNDSVVISAPTDTRITATTFDFIDDEDYYSDTLFDGNATQFRDTRSETGALYMYDYLSNYRESITNTGAYTFAQSIINRNIQIVGSPRFGNTVDFSDGVVVASAPEFIGVPYSNARGLVYTGQVVVWLNETEYTTDWMIDRVPGATVDINSMGTVHLYDYTTNTTLTTLDWWDPLQGVLLGAVRTNLDYIAAVDPAQYNSPLYTIDSTAAQQNGLLTSTQNQVVWGAENVGRLWFDTSTTLWVNYHQTDPVYNSEWWGRVFPGSDVAVYTWVSSTELPAQWTGPGIPYDIQRYAIDYVTSSTGNLVPLYYYWVRNTNTVNTKLNKTLSDTVLQAYIAAPRSSGIEYFAPLLPNAYALYNCAPYINDYNTILHIGYDSGVSDDVPHTQVQLIRDNYKDDYLPGVPPTVAGSPTELYLKWLNSMTGVDDNGSLVPNIYLPQKVRNGVLNSPMQSMFTNRFAALQNYLEYVNSVLIQFPVRETKNPSFLFKIGDNYDTTLYWEYVNWWAPGYSDTTLPSLQVQNYNDLELLNVPPNTVARVLANGIGLAEYWVYRVNSPGVWVRIGVENGTIQFLAPLWDYTINQVGWDGNSFDTTNWDAYPSVETLNCLRAINEQLLVDDLLLYRNRGLMVCFEYACTELDINGAYLPWLNKTSFVDVINSVNRLATFNVYRTDKFELLSGHIREVKPYHVTLREFIYKYTVLDTVGMRYTDFDFPSLYNENTASYISPQIAYVNPQGINQFTLDDPIWLNDRYIDYRQNWGISLTGRNDYVITTTAAAFGVFATKIPVKNPHSFPVNGVITLPGSSAYYDGWDYFTWDSIGYDTGVSVDIPGEQIYYGGVDLIGGYLTNVIRGYNNTTPRDFEEGVNVLIDLPGVIVLQSGRNYATTPNITVTYDTTLYPAPREAIELAPIMSNGAVIGITILNPGSGYGIQPTITVDPAYSLYPIAIDPVLNTLTFSTPSFLTGDKIRYVVGTNTLRIGGLIDGNYYYAGVISTTPGTHVIALYNDLNDARLDQNRIVFINSGSGIEHWFSYGAIAEPVMSNRPVRELRTTFAWDRVTYQPTRAWSSGTYYAPAYNTNTVTIKRPIISILSITGTDVAKFVVDYYNTELEPAHLNRLEVNYLTAPGNLGDPPQLKIGYLKLINAATVELYSDNQFLNGIKSSDLLLTSFTTSATVFPSSTEFIGTIIGDTIIASSTGSTLTVSSSILNGITLGAKITGSDVQPGTIITAFGTGTGGAGTYSISPAQTFNSTSIIVAGNILNVTVLTSGVLSVGDTIVGANIEPNTTIIAFGTGTGGVGTYIVDTPQLVSTLTTIKVATNKLTLGSVVGYSVDDPVFFTNITNIPELVRNNTYYVSSINTATNEITLQGTPINSTSLGSATIFTGSRYFFSRLSINIPADRVLINSTLYQCRLANNDTVFDPTKWTVISQTEVDRIDSYYKPTVNMIGKDVGQLLAGVTYPNAVYSGSPFSWDGTSQIDTYLIDPAWPSNILYNIVEGSSFNSGYAPEELLAGQFKELINIYVTSDDAILKYLMTIVQTGNITDTLKNVVFNINPSKQTLTTSAMIRDSDFTDILNLANVNTVLYQTVYPVDPITGQVIVPTVANILSVNVPGWTMLNGITLQINPPYPATVTVTAGSIILVSYVDTTDGITKSEYIGFQRYDTITNTITQLRRGLFNSSIQNSIPAGATVYAINPNNRLPDEYMNKWWYGALGSNPALANNTLAADTVNPAALFLQTP